MTICPVCNNKIEPRSLNQNNYWWLCMSIIGKEVGYTAEQMSLLIKEQFNWYEEFPNRKTGEVHKIYESSAKWSKKQFAINTELVLQFASDYNIKLLTPEEFFNQ